MEDLFICGVVTCRAAVGDASTEPVWPLTCPECGARSYPADVAAEAGSAPAATLCVRLDDRAIPVRERGARARIEQARRRADAEAAGHARRPWAIGTVLVLAGSGACRRSS